MTYYTRFINFSCKPEFNLSIENKEIILNFIMFTMRQFKQHTQNISTNIIKDIHFSLNNFNEFKELINEFNILYFETFNIHFS